MTKRQQQKNRHSQRLKEQETQAKKQAKRTSGKKVEVGTKEPTKLPLKLGRAGSWGKWQLDVLGAIFAKNRTLELNDVLNVKPEEWPLELQKRVDDGAAQLGLIEASALQGGDIQYIDSVPEKCPAFAMTFTALKNVMAIQTSKEAKKLELAKAAPTDRPSADDSTLTSQGNKRKRSVTASPPSERHSKRSKKGTVETVSTDVYETPPKPTVPADPNYSGESTESKAEYFTEKLLSLFVEQTLQYLRSDFRLIHWKRNGIKAELVETGREQTKVKLGMETIVSINDGGLSFGFTADGKNKIWQPHGQRPILSLEAKRRRSDKRGDKDLEYQHAGQMFAEMLGQVCYKEFFNNELSKYQESFVIHGRHSSVTIYWAKFPNAYLKNIYKYGVHFLANAPTDQRVMLCRTKTFHMRNTEERLELYRNLAKLFWYLISGRAHVGYTLNYPGNPLHNAGHSTLVDRIPRECPVEEDNESSGSSLEVSISRTAVTGDGEGDVDDDTWNALFNRS